MASHQLKSIRVEIASKALLVDGYVADEPEIDARFNYLN
jgi:hypothetical protein